MAGCDWISPANDSKTYTTDPLCTFELSTDADVYIASDDRITTKPSWMSSWTDTGDNIVDDETTPVTYSLYKKTYSAGLVSLGNNGHTINCLYTIIVKPVE